MHNHLTYRFQTNQKQNENKYWGNKQVIHQLHKVREIAHKSSWKSFTWDLTCYRAHKLKTSLGGLEHTSVKTKPNIWGKKRHYSAINWKIRVKTWVSPSPFIDMEQEHFESSIHSQNSAKLNLGQVQYQYQNSK